MIAAAIATVAGTALAFGNLAGIRVPGLDHLERTSVDVRFKLRGPVARGNDEVVIVGLDNKLRLENPDVFLRHESFAKLIAAISANKPRTIAVDAFFDTPDAILPPAVISRVAAAHAEALAIPVAKRGVALEHAASALGAVLDESKGDELLAAAIRDAGNVYLGTLFFFEKSTAAPSPAADFRPELRNSGFDDAAVLAAPPSRSPPRARSNVWSSLPVFAAGAVGAGHTNVLPDADNTVRRMYGPIELGGTYYAPLGLKLASTHASGGALSFVTGAKTIRAGERALPVDERGLLTIDWLGPRGSFETISGADVLDGTAPRTALENKLVLVGLTDAARDLIQTPFDEMPGVEAHATLAWQALFGRFLRHVSPAWTVAICVLLGGLATLLQSRRIRKRSAWLAPIAGLAVIALYLVATQLLFSRAGLIAAAVSPALTGVVALAAALVAALAVEEREKHQLRNALTTYVSSAVAQRILDDPSAAQLGGVRREVSLLFSDIRGFSHFSERLDPEELSTFLSEYFTPMSEMVMAEDGLVDKYVGDAVVAIFGAPLEQAAHAAHACRSALAMMAALGPLNEDWKRRGLPEVRIGVGLNTGVVAVGNMGAVRRFNYTALGDAVNLASRLEGLTKEFHASILCGSRTRELAGDGFVFRELDRVRVVGRDGAERIYELLGDAASSPLSVPELAAFEEAMAAYRAREWERAETLFAKFVASHPGDGPAGVFLERVQTLRRNPPAADWDGIYRQAAK